MIAIGFSEIQQTPDIEVKQAAALKQMRELHARLQDCPKYHTLTVTDRQRLIKEGYAADLVDNLVFITQRNSKTLSASKDELMTGFTYAAFDPALYATDEITVHLKQLSQGCCCYCESFLIATESGKVSHFRPVQLLDHLGSCSQSIINQCSPYFELAYQQDNLVYCCTACDEQYKAGLFPTKHQRYPELPLAQEQSLLVDPYYDEPRQFIRFNPRNGQAYAYDMVRLFYKETQSLGDDCIAELLWKNPETIPNQTNAAGQLISQAPLNKNYQQWLSDYLDNGGYSKGQVTIDTLGLNRKSLVMARLATLNQLKFVASCAEKDQLNDVAISATHAYRSLAIDALHTWYYQTVSSEVSQEPVHLQTVESQVELTATPTNKSPQALNFPQWFRASLRYFVSESELGQVNKRQLVCLSSQDKVYGRQPKEKCIFLPIDWNTDSNNIIKVRSHRNIWESSFSELSRSRPLELMNLFTHNDIWVEGAYEALTA
ncbi:hypothetical protein [Shewanella woodyi]|uniref:hypothetical protein n=1 Tax=Shewanella woodyi TaxID=60961 RepID=UPI003749F77F